MSTFIDSLMTYLVSIGTADGYIVVGNASTPDKFVNANIGYDRTNRRITLMGTVTPSMSGRIDKIYFEVLSPSGTAMAELMFINLATYQNLEVRAGNTYRVLVSITYS